MELVHNSAQYSTTYFTFQVRLRVVSHFSLGKKFSRVGQKMWTVHISMTSKFQCEYCKCFTFKRCDKFKLKCTSHGGMYSAHYFGKISITSKQ